MRRKERREAGQTALFLIRFAVQIGVLGLKGCGARLLVSLVFVGAVCVLGAVLLEGGVVAIRYGWRLAFAPWSFDTPERPALLGQWRGTIAVESAYRTVVLNLEYRYRGTMDSEITGRANVAGWLALCTVAGRMTSAYRIEATIGTEPPKPFLASYKEAIVPDPDYAFSFRLTWTGHAMTLALPFARRVGSSLVSSSADPTPTATLRRVGSPTSHEPGCD